MNHYPHHIGDWKSATGHLTLVERALYLALIHHYYDQEGPIQHDELPALCRKIGARSEDEIAAVDVLLGEFFTFADGAWHHKKCDAVLAAYRVKSEVAKANAVRSHEVRYGKQRKKLASARNSLAIGQPESGGSSANQEPITNNQGNNPPNPPQGGEWAGLPPELDTPEFKACWLDWLRHRKEIKKPVAPTGQAATWAKAVEAGAEAAIRGMRQSMSAGWQGIFIDTKADNKANKRSKEYAESQDIPKF
jgi:uncharacterized protein YdaU (DUF1376 family)